MNNFQLLYHAEDKDFIEKTLRPLIDDLVSSEVEMADFNEANEGPFLLFLSDENIKLLLPKLIKFERPLALLPHKDCKTIAMSMGYRQGLRKTTNYLKELEALEGVELDVLYCNNRPVFGHLVLGETFQFFSHAQGSLRSFIKRSFTLRPFPLEMNLKDEKCVRTVAAGAIITMHRQSSLLSRLVPGESAHKEGVFHLFILSPRSLLELLVFTLKSFVLKEYLPSFGAHVKSDQVTLLSGEATNLRYSIDGNAYTDRELKIEVMKDYLRVIPGESFDAQTETKAPREIYRLSSLPTGEAAQELAQKTLPFIKSASTEDFKDLFMVLRENAKPKNSYLVLMVLATVLATFGLFANSTPVVIGAMILAPLMAPIITLSMATLRQDKQLIIQSLSTIFLGMGLAFLSAAVITFLTPISVANAEILARVHPTLLDLGVAVVSGIAGAYAHAREEVAKTLAGVAIAVALVPPLAVSAIGFAWMDLSIFAGASLLLITNLAGITLSGALTFLVLGFSPFRLAKRGVVVSLTAVTLLSIPLGLSFYRMVDEHRVVRLLNDYQVQDFRISEVRVHHFRPLTIGLRVLTENPLTNENLDEIKSAVENRLGSSAKLEITTAITR